MGIKFLFVNKIEQKFEFRFGLSASNLEFSEYVSAKVFHQKGHKIRCSYQTSYINYVEA